MIEIDIERLERELVSGTHAMLVSSSQSPPPPVSSAAVDGISSAGLFTHSLLAAFLGTMMLGGASVPTREPGPPNILFEVLTPLDVSTVRRSETAERFLELRRRIVESGIPLLDDEELRQEISERKGTRV